MSVIPALFYLLVLTQAERVLEKETTSREVQLRDIVARRGGRHVTKEDVDNLARMAHISKATEENQMDDFWGDPEEENRLPKGTTVWGGDMVIRPTDLMKETQINGSSLMEVGAGGRGFETWPHGQVYYRFQGNPPNHLKEKFRAACDEWSRRVGCLQFIEIQHRAQPVIDVTFSDRKGGGGCWSYVGYGSPDAINLGTGCDDHGIILHEIGHAIGRTHEHSRWDRDEWVEIKWDMIKHGDGIVHNFRKQYQAYTQDHYDYGSIMHYSSSEFSRDSIYAENRRKTIVAKKAMPPGVELGNRESLSEQDVAKLQDMYGCRVQQRCVPTYRFCPSSYECGTLDDGCGQMLPCGGPDACDGRACIRHKCINICIPDDCPQELHCGWSEDGCGGHVFCGDCSETETCIAHQCRAVPEVVVLPEIPARQIPEQQIVQGATVGLDFFEEQHAVAIVQRVTFDNERWSWMCQIKYEPDWAMYNGNPVLTRISQEHLFVAQLQLPEEPPEPNYEKKCKWILKLTGRRQCGVNQAGKKVLRHFEENEENEENTKQCQKLAEEDEECGFYVYYRSNGACACVKSGYVCTSLPSNTISMNLYYKDCGDQCPPYATSPDPDANGNCFCASFDQQSKQTGLVVTTQTSCYRNEQSVYKTNTWLRGQCEFFEESWTKGFGTSSASFHVHCKDCMCCASAHPHLKKEQCVRKKLMA